MAKAVRFDTYGGRDVLYLADVDVPTPAPGEVQVEVRAAGINPGEASIRQGKMDAIFPSTFPSGEGSDLAGVVTMVGHAKGTFAVGDEVMGWTDGRASHAEFVVVPEDHLIHKPKALSWDVAGSLYVVGVTAYAAVRAVQAGQGDTVVVSAAAGGVGSVVVQLLKVKGSSVIGIASEANHTWLASLGATPVAYGDGLADRIRAAAPSGVDAFIDTFGGDYVRLAIDLGIARDRIDTIADFGAAERYGVKTEGSASAARADVLAEVADLAASGAITVPVARTYPLDHVKDAYSELEQRHTHGKIVLIP